MNVKHCQFFAVLVSFGSVYDLTSKLNFRFGSHANTFDPLTRRTLVLSPQNACSFVIDQSPANSVYHQPVQQKSPATPFLSPAASNSLCTAQQSQPPAPPSAVYNSYSGQASCYPGQQGAGGSTSTPVDMRGAMYNQREMNTAPDLAHLIAAVNGGNNSNQQPQDIVINRDVVSFQNIIQEGTNYN